MGPFNAHVQLPMASHGPIIFLEAAANGLGWAYFNTLGWLLMVSCAPIIFLRAAANALGWAHLLSISEKLRQTKIIKKIIKIIEM